MNQYIFGLGGTKFLLGGTSFLFFLLNFAEKIYSCFDTGKQIIKTGDYSIQFLHYSYRYYFYFQVEDRRSYTLIAPCKRSAARG